MARSGLVCASRVVGFDRLWVGSYVRLQRGQIGTGLCESCGRF